jgi:penicillin-binding protein 2
LTTPPHREALEPLVVQEELDYHPLVPEVSLAIAAEIESHPELYPGLRIELSTRRRYSRGTLAPHLIGYRTTITDEALASRHKRFPQGDPLDYRTGDRVGMAGLERYYERHLRGLRGERKLILNRAGEVIRTEIVRRPRLGRDLVLTLNVAAQQAAEGLLDEVLSTRSIDETTKKPMPIPQGGAIVAIDVRTGAVLAAASAPRFDVNALVTHDQEAWKRIVADARKPLFPRVTHMALPPGSTFKIVSAVAFLQQGSLDPEANFHCQGYLDKPDKYRCYTFRNFGVGHNDVNLTDALARSCNVYFFAAARRSGPAALHEWAGKFGFGSPTGIDLPGERGGNLPLLPITPRRGKPRLSGDTLGMAIGQAQLTATPLQVARMTAAVANGGKLVTPRLVESAGTAVMSDDSPSTNSGMEDLSIPEPQSIPDLSSRSLDWVRLGLRKVVSDPHGTGYKTIRLKDVAIAGKTGTAEPGGDRPDHAWFAGYVPADQPRIAFVVVLEHAGSGGHAAGPVARKFVEALLLQGLLNSTGQATTPSAN